MQNHNVALTLLGGRCQVTLTDAEHLTFEAATVASNVSRLTADAG